MVKEVNVRDKVTNLKDVLQGQRSLVSDKSLTSLYPPPPGIFVCGVPSIPLYPAVPGHQSDLVAPQPGSGRGLQH